MIWLIIIFTALHVLFNLYMFFGWKKIKPIDSSIEPPGVSIVIPVRNEEDTISQVLTCLAMQEYPTEKFEVLVVDDFSKDDTWMKVKECMEKLPLDLQFISLKDESKTGKKHALTVGINSSRFDYILTTDSDCQMGSQWIKSYGDSISKYQFVAGPVAVKGSGWFERMQQMEFSGLIGFGAVTISDNNPSMCSGANLGFSKQVFAEVGGYENNIDIPSGDDEFLLYNVLQKYPGEATFLKNRAAIVVTPAHQSFSMFINQRIRWTSKWKYNRNRKLRLIAILFFFDYLFYYILLSGLIVGFLSFQITIFIFLIRLLTDYLYIYPVNKFHGNKSSICILVSIQIIYPAHVLFMGVRSIFDTYTWKGRKY